VRQHLVWDPIPFDIPGEIYQAWDAKARGAELENGWNTMFAEYRAQHPELAAELERRMKGELPGNFNETLDAAIATCIDKKETIATRKASQNAIQALAPILPEFLGGSADLTGSNLTNWKESSPCVRASRATTSTTACANSAWPRSRTASPCTAASSRSARPS
jgi:transketolase